MTPTVTSGSPSTAVSSQTMRSQDSANSSPPPRAKPCTAAIVGTRRSSTPVNAARKCGRWAIRSASLNPFRSLRSAPTQNALVGTEGEHHGAYGVVGGHLARRIGELTRAIAVDKALWASGRSSTISTT